MSVGRIITLVIGAIVVAALVYTGVWHIFTQFVWQYPMLSWLPLLALLVVGFVAGSVRAMLRAGGTPSATAGPSPAEQIAAPAAAGAGEGAETTPQPSVTTPVAPATTPTRPIGFAWALGI